MTIEFIINSWDPIGLFPYSPQDEYSSEIQKIKFARRKTDDAFTFGDHIYQIFIESFGPEIFQKSLSECVSVAEKIMSIS